VDYLSRRENVRADFCASNCDVQLGVHIRRTFKGDGPRRLRPPVAFARRRASARNRLTLRRWALCCSISRLMPPRSLDASHFAFHGRRLRPEMDRRHVRDTAFSRGHGMAQLTTSAHALPMSSMSAGVAAIPATFASASRPLALSGLGVPLHNLAEAICDGVLPRHDEFFRSHCAGRACRLSLPVTDWSTIDVNEPRARIVTDAAALQARRCIAHLGQATPLRPKIDRHALGMIAVFRYAFAMQIHLRVGHGRSVTADNQERIARIEPFAHHPEHVENAGIHRTHLVGVMIPQDPVDVPYRLSDVVSVGPVDGAQPFAGVRVVKRYRSRRIRNRRSGLD
jgi:hypothetical protein